MATFEEDARYIVGRLVDAGYRWSSRWTTRGLTCGIPVAHVIVPGLQCCPR